MMLTVRCFDCTYLGQAKADFSLAAKLKADHWEQFPGHRTYFQDLEAAIATALSIDKLTADHPGSELDPREPFGEFMAPDGTDSAELFDDWDTGKADLYKCNR